MRTSLRRRKCQAYSHNTLRKKTIFFLRKTKAAKEEWTKKSRMSGKKNRGGVRNENKKCPPARIFYCSGRDTEAEPLSLFFSSLPRALRLKNSSKKNIYTKRDIKKKVINTPERAHQRLSQCIEAERATKY